LDFVLAIHTRENGQGMMSTEEDEPPTTDGSQEGASKSKRPHLRVVK
jgi:stringent starvation protein B